MSFLNYKGLFHRIKTFFFKRSNFLETYGLLKRMKKIRSPFKLYIIICFLLPTIFGCLILYSISINQMDYIYLLKFFSRIFLFAGVVLKAYSEYDCLNKNLKDFTDKEVITLKNFIVIKFFFRGLLTIFCFIVFIGCILL